MFNAGDRVRILDNATYYQGCLGRVSCIGVDRVDVIILGGESNSLPKHFTVDELELDLEAQFSN